MLRALQPFAAPIQPKQAAPFRWDVAGQRHYFATMSRVVHPPIKRRTAGTAIALLATNSKPPHRHHALD